ncbi:hypothetical protein BT69DRAFT_1300121 [Atractiella rhizophila]|nr:hypothetical protein BT69DRAFT_1300121 [Atractiella rhizophila]
MAASQIEGVDSKVKLDLRGRRFTLERDSLMELPESVLLCLFPNGVVLSSQRAQGGEMDGAEEEEEEVYYVDFDGPCLDFILNFFLQAKEDFYGPPSAPTRPNRDFSDPAAASNPLFHKQAIIVLREELEYFAIPPKKPTDGTAITEDFPSTDDEGLPNKGLLDLKKECGQQLLERKSIFTALQRNVNRENNLAEQHLIDMLCMSGFDRADEWGYRSLELNRCCIASIALVLLKTGIGQPPEGSDPNTEEGQPPVNAQQLATAQKLLLFWRKPARKCWWDATEIELPSMGKVIKVWARRVWTLELSLVRHPFVLVLVLTPGVADIIRVKNDGLATNVSVFDD